VALFVLRVKRPNRKRPYRAIGIFGASWIYIVMALFIECCAVRYKPQFTAGLIIVLLGCQFISYGRGRDDGSRASSS